MTERKEMEETREKDRIWKEIGKRERELEEERKARKAKRQTEKRVEAETRKK